MKEAKKAKKKIKELESIYLVEFILRDGGSVAIDTQILNLEKKMFIYIFYRYVQYVVHICHEKLLTRLCGNCSVEK